jgi:hypothetical protein
MISPTENGPTGTAVNGIYIDTNCARVTIISPNTTSTNNTQSGGVITTLISDNGGASTLPGNLHLGSLIGPIFVNGANGNLFFRADTDGGEFNIGSDANGTLAIYGSGAATLHVNLLDGDLKTNSVVRLTNGGQLQNTRIQKRINSVASSATPSINTDTTDEFHITALAANITSMTTNLTGTPNDGDELTISFKDNATPRTIAWGASFQSSGSQTLLATTSTSKTHYVKLRWSATISKWICQYVDATGF